MCQCGQIFPRRSDEIQDFENHLRLWFTLLIESFDTVFVPDLWSFITNY